MKLKLVARHLKDDVDHVIDEAGDIIILLDRMTDEIESNKSEGSNWRYSIVPDESVYK